MIQKLKNNNKKIKLLLIGRNSLIAKNYLKHTKLKKNQITSISHLQIKKIDFKIFTHLINFSYDPIIKSKSYYKSNLIDKKICSLINNNKLIYIYPSSRLVYKIKSKKNIFKKKNIYGKNKIIIENLIKKFQKRKYLILRIPNILEFSLQNKDLFITRLLTSLKKYNLINLDIDKKSYKDFITFDFFSQCLDALIIKKQTGTLNISSGKKIDIYQLCKAIINGYKRGKIIYSKVLYSDSFVLNNFKLKKITNLSISKREIMDYSYQIGNKLKKYG